MSDRINLNDFIRLGESICIVANPQQWHAAKVVEQIDELSRAIKACGMGRSSMIVEPLRELVLDYSKTSGFIDPHSIKELQTGIKAALATIADEASGQEVVAINTGAVSQQLRGVSQALRLTKSQEKLLSETVLCLERGAFRAAVVMGWCFAYDVIRCWVYNDAERLQKFNDKLGTYTNKKSGSRLYDDIVAYEDFYCNKGPAEGRVIDICESSGLIGGKIARKFRHYLDVRNEYAHATSSQPSGSQANAFIDDLIDIITNPAFK